MSKTLTGKHGVEVGAAGGQHHLVRLDLLAGHVQHDVAKQAALPHAVHGHEGVVVVPLGVVRDAVAIAVQQLHAALHHGAALLGLPGPWPHSRQLGDGERKGWSTICTLLSDYQQFHPSIYWWEYDAVQTETLNYSTTRFFPLTLLADDLSVIDAHLSHFVWA